MNYPAKLPLIFGMAMLTLTLGACGSDKAESASNTATTQAKTQTLAQDTAEVMQESDGGSVEDSSGHETVAKDVVNATENTANPIKPLSIKEGKKRYEQTCKVCHDQGLLDAPKLSNKAEWTKRLEKGVDTLYQHSAKGFNKMPAQATGAVTEAEVYAAVDYILEQTK